MATWDIKKINTLYLVTDYRYRATLISIDTDIGILNIICIHIYIPTGLLKIFILINYNQLNYNILTTKTGLNRLKILCTIRHLFTNSILRKQKKNLFVVKINVVWTIHASLRSVTLYYLCKTNFCLPLFCNEIITAHICNLQTLMRCWW